MPPLHTYLSRARVCSFADQHRALSFTYVITPGDEAAHFKQAGSDALELHNNATIKRASTTPTTNALISLPVSEGGVYIYVYIYIFIHVRRLTIIAQLSILLVSSWKMSVFVVLRLLEKKSLRGCRR